MDEAAQPAPLHWETVLRPHRSLPPQGFRIVMLVLGIVSFAWGLFFVLLGAWPVLGFFGLDVALVYLAFKMNYRSARMREILRLAGGDFTVERVSVRGEVRLWRFQAFWLRIRLIEQAEDANRLVLTSHGRSLAVAGFLTAAERRGLKTEIDRALERWRAAVA